MNCTNSKCESIKATSFFGKFFNGEGVVRENLWYCHDDCFRSAVMNDFYLRKRNQRELRSSSYPVTSRSFGSALLRMGKITWHQLEEALDEKSRNGDKPMAHYLLKKGLIDRKDILAALGKHHRVPVALVGERILEADLIDLVPTEIARISGILPFTFNKKKNTLAILMKDPSDLTSLIAVRKLSRCEVRPFQGDPAEIDRLVNHYYNGAEFYRESWSGSANKNFALAN